MKTDPLTRPLPVDMSPEAIDGRLRELADLHRLGHSLATARRVGHVTKDGQVVRDAEPPRRPTSEP